VKKRILITGATGMFGATLSKYFQDNFEVFATGTKDLNFDGIKNFMAFDLSSSDYSKLIEWSKPDTIIHAAALTNGNYCEQNPEQAFAINGISLQKFCKAIPEQTQLIYISTDAVFSNDKHLANETDCVHPESVYGKAKELGEFFLRHSNCDYTIVRTTIVGKNLNKNKQGFVEWIVNSSSAGSEISLFDDVLFTPISIWNLAEHLEYIINNPTAFSRKTFHVAGREICTKYQFGITLLKSLNLPTGLVKRGKITDFEDRAKRSTDQTLDCKRFEEVSQRQLPTLKQTIQELKDHYDEAN